MRTGATDVPRLNTPSHEQSFLYDAFSSYEHDDRAVAAGIEKRLRPPTPQPGPILPPDYAEETWDQLRIEWPQLGDQTVVNVLGEMRDKVLGVDDYTKWKAAQ